MILFEKERDTTELHGIEERLRALIIRAEDRGRDSYGIVSFENDNSVIYENAVDISIDDSTNFGVYDSIEIDNIIINENAVDTAVSDRNEISVLQQNDAEITNSPGMILTDNIEENDEEYNLEGRFCIND